MKRIYYALFFIISGVFANTQAQPILKDAIALSEFLKDNPNKKTIAKLSSDISDQEEYLLILLQYVNFEEGMDIEQAVSDGFFGNPFLSDQQGESIILLPNEYHSEFSIFDTKSEGIPATGTPSAGMFVSNFADGLARFLAKRAKQELTTAFFRDFQRKVTANEYLQPLFPETANLLLVIDEEIYQFNTYLGALRETFVRDLKVLPMNLSRSIEMKGWLDDNPELEILSTDLLALSQMLVDGKKPVEFIRYLGVDALLQDFETVGAELDSLAKQRIQDIAAQMKSIELISSSLRSTLDDINWVSAQELENALSDKKILYLYLGLLYQKAAGIEFGDGRNLQDGMKILANTASAVEKLRSQLLRFVDYGESIKRSLDQAKIVIESDTTTTEVYYQYFDYLFALVETGIDIRNTFLPNLGSDSLVIQFMTDLKQLNYLQLNVRQKRYSLAMTNLMYILDRFLKDSEFDQKTKGLVLKYGMFMATVAESTSAEEVASAIELFALPPGSSTLKKHASFSFSLNAYTGIAYGREILEQEGAANTIAIGAPIGLAMNFGLGGRRGSMSFFTSIIDVGAITAYRFDDANTANLPALEWSNILAPGAFAIYGMGWDLPVSIGIGAQMGPNLRNVTNGQLTIDDRGWRVLGFIAVDIPILHFYTKK